MNDPNLIQAIENVAEQIGWVAFWLVLIVVVLIFLGLELSMRKKV